MEQTEIDLSQEFTSPDVNLLILLHEIEQELKLMQLDLTQIQSPIIKGFALKEYMTLKEKYFYLMAEDLKLLKMYETEEETSDESL